MDYINVELFDKKGLELTDLPLLQLIRQNRSIDLENFLSRHLTLERLSRFEDLGLIEFIASKKKSDTLHKRVRLSKKGVTVLEDVSTPEITEDDITIYNWLAGIYKSTDREVGNARKTKMHIACFRVESGIEKNCLLILCRAFMEDPDQFEWSRKLEYLFFKPANVYSVRFDIHQSRLFQYYEKHKVTFDKQFEKHRT